MTTNQQRQKYFDALGIQRWVRRDLPDGDQNDAITGSEPEEIPLLDWEMLQAEVAACTACELHKTRTQTVFGVGNRNAQWLIVGEAPGAEEDRQGEPFVGRAGQLLNAMLLAIGLQREQVYIANILKCRPPNNRDPRPEEVACCEPFLKRQVALLKPRIILAVGRIAAQNLLKTDTRIGALRGKRYTYADTGIPVVVTYHPAYLLRSPKEKRKAWQDLLYARKVLGEEKN
jgi:DNA polymerase